MRYTDAEGAVRRESTGTENKQLAQLALDAKRAEVWEHKKLGVKQKMLFSKACEIFLETKADKDVHEDYERQLTWWQAQFGKTACLHDVTQSRIIDIVEAGAKERGWTKATKNRYLSPLRSVMRYAALKRQWISANQLPAFFMEKESTGRTRWLKPDEISRLIAALPEHWKDIAGFALATGQRMGNVLGLRWDQVDLVRRVVVFEGDVMKNGDAHGIPLNDTAVELVRRQIGLHVERVFTYKGKPIHKGGAATWRRALEKAGLEGTGVVKHSFRHTWATMMMNAGVSDGLLMAMGSWKTAKMVRRYAHANAQSLLPYARQIDATLTGALSGVTQTVTHSSDGIKTPEPQPLRVVG
jgi:integrase